MQTRGKERASPLRSTAAWAALKRKQTDGQEILPQDIKAAFETVRRLKAEIKIDILLVELAAPSS
eukprot:COSAG01_NODE_18927_length_1043_cov_1.122881_2_plen_65_part_00